MEKYLYLAPSNLVGIPTSYSVKLFSTSMHYTSLSYKCVP